MRGPRRDAAYQPRREVVAEQERDPAGGGDNGPNGIGSAAIGRASDQRDADDAPLT